MPGGEQGGASGPAEGAKLFKSIAKLVFSAQTFLARTTWFCSISNLVPTSFFSRLFSSHVEQGG
jgi:hypothetical protein